MLTKKKRKFEKKIKNVSFEILKRNLPNHRYHKKIKKQLIKTLKNVSIKNKKVNQNVNK
jgi:hypothetical protein